MQASWRAEASRTCQDDLDSLLDYCLNYATDALSAYKELRPFAVTVSHDGQMNMVAFATTDAQTTSQGMTAALIGGMRAQRESLRATALTFGIMLETTQQSAIRVNLEHSEGTSLAVDMPFALTGSKRKLSTADLLLSLAAHNIWVHEP